MGLGLGCFGKSSKRLNREAGSLDLPSNPQHHTGQDQGQGHEEAQFNGQHLQKLQEKYEEFEKRNNNLPREYRHVVEYVQSLEESLGNVKRKAESLLKDVNGDETARDIISQTGSTSEIVDLIFRNYKDQSNSLKTNQRRIRQLDETVQEVKKRSELEAENRRRDHNTLVQRLNDERFYHKQALKQEHSHHEQELSEERSQCARKLQKLTEDNNRDVKTLEREHENRVNELKDDIRTLQDAAINRVDRFTPRSDSELRGQFRQLKSSVRSVARSPWDTGSQNLGDPAHIRTFIQTAPEQHHKYALEGKLWSILEEGIFATPFKVLGGYGDCFFTSWCMIHQNSRRPDDLMFNWPPLSTSTEKWRATTFEMLAQLLSTNDPMIKESRDTNLKNVYQTLCMTLSLVSSQNQDSELWRIVSNAVDLAIDMAEQRCRLQLFYPSINDAIFINSETYESVNLGSSTGSTKRDSATCG